MLGPQHDGVVASGGRLGEVSRPNSSAPWLPVSTRRDGMALTGHAEPRPEKLLRICAQALSSGNEKIWPVFPMLSPAVCRTMSEVGRCVLCRVPRLSPAIGCSRLRAAPNLARRG